MPGLAQTVMVFDWLIRKYETFSLVNSWCLRNKVKLACHLLSIMHVLFSAPHSLSSSSLILGGKIVHINEVKGKLALFSTKDNVLLTPHPSYSFTINFFTLLEDISYIPGSLYDDHFPLSLWRWPVRRVQPYTVFTAKLSYLQFEIKEIKTRLHEGFLYLWPAWRSHNSPPPPPHGFATHSSAKTSSAVRKNEPALIIRDGRGRAYQNVARANDSAG